METIVALATPPGNSGVAVIRLSGDGCKQILTKIVGEEFEIIPRTMYLKKVKVGQAVDNCLVVFFAAPFSFTGEDVVEIQSHGGYFLAQSIIDECVRLGARPASAGEFSKRAFLNGKMSLDQAEGLMELINAETKLQLELGSKLMDGKLLGFIEQVSGELTDILAEIEAKLDYPEYEYSQAESSNVLLRLKEIKDRIESIVATSQKGQIIKNGIKVALTGAPNVGKSSLLNALTNSNKAIVTEIAGTTRDVVEGEYIYKGIVFKLFDTAGIREGADRVEQIGIERALLAVEDADIVLKIFDSNNSFEVQTSKPVISVANKSDEQKLAGKDIIVSAKTGENIEKLKEMIFDKTVGENLNNGAFYLTNARHTECMVRAAKNLAEAIEVFNNTTFDIVSNIIKQAWHALKEITGETGEEEIVDKIFSKFCLGK